MTKQGIERVFNTGDQAELTIGNVNWTSKTPWNGCGT